MSHHLFYRLLLFVVLLSVLSCQTVPKVTRVEVAEQIDLSGNWNDTDSRLVSEEMIKDVMSRPWLDEFFSSKKRKPAVIVGTILNKSHEHISTETFVKDLERELINYGKIKFVASRQQREEIREERKEHQLGYVEPTTAKEFGKEVGADFMLKGQINTIYDEAGKTQLKYYQVELELIDIETNEKVWIGQKKIKKTVLRPRHKM